MSLGLQAEFFHELRDLRVATVVTAAGNQSVGGLEVERRGKPWIPPAMRKPLTAWFRAGIKVERLLFALFILSGVPAAPRPTMKDKLLGAGIIGAVIAALYCFKPILAWTLSM